MNHRSPVVLVTGASSGIGRAVANAFAAKGFEVFGTSRNPSRTEPIPGVELVGLDVADAASVTAAVSTVVQRAGRIDILVNNAGFGVIGAAEESSAAQAQQLFETNFFGLVRLTREVLPYLRAQRSGRIINIGSVLGIVPAPYAALYAALKARGRGILRIPGPRNPRVRGAGHGRGTRLHHHLLRGKRDRRRCADRQLRDSRASRFDGPSTRRCRPGTTPRWSHTSCSRRRPTVRRSCAIQPGPWRAGCRCCASSPRPHCWTREFARRAT